jgi:integrase
VLGRDLGRLDGILRPRRPVRVPLVLSREEVGAVLRHLHGVTWLMAALLYGCGLRLLECAALRVKDVDLARLELTVRDGKGRRDRVTMIPARLKAPLVAHLERVRRQHEEDLRAGRGRVALPDALRLWGPAQRAHSRLVPPGGGRPQAMAWQEGGAMGRPIPESDMLPQTEGIMVCPSSRLLVGRTNG